MPDHSDRAATQKHHEQVTGGLTSLEGECMWSHERISGRIGRFSGAQMEFSMCRQYHSIVLTLSGGTTVTGSRISTSSIYEGRDGPGCVSLVPADVERLGWYRNADMVYVSMHILPDFVRSWELDDKLENLEPFTNQRDSLLESILWSFSGEMRDSGPDLLSLYAEHAAGLVMAHLMRRASRTKVRPSWRGGLSQAQLRLVFDYIEDHLERNISLSNLGALVRMGPDVFARNFKLHVGVPPYRYLLSRRMRRAEALLSGRDKTIAEIAFAVGFASQSHFTTHFSREKNVTPAAYRTLRRK